MNIFIINGHQKYSFSKVRLNSNLGKSEILIDKSKKVKYELL